MSGPAWPGARFGLTRFVGREAETAESVRLLREHRLVTMVGAPGVGKTRLAVEVGRAAAEEFRDGVRQVALAAVSPGDVVTEVAGALDIRDGASSRVADSVVDALRSAETLLVLDNCEHLTEEVTDLVGHLLLDAPDVRVLATSRVPLGLPGERLHRVPALSVSSAAELFADRAALVTDLVLDDAGTEYVDRICRRLDGLPLAIELAARQARALSLRDLLARLDTELPRAAVPGHPTPAHTTMAATIGWSCRFLSAEQVQLFARLSVFAGDFDVRAAEAVAGPDPRLLTDLTALVDHSLVLAEPAEAGSLRYRMLEPIRQYAAALLDDRGETDVVRGRHAAHFLEVARVASRGLMKVNGHHWCEELRRAEGNVLAAVNWARGTRSDLALRLVTYQASYWEQRSHVNAARERLDGLLDHGMPGPRARAEALLALCNLGYRQGRYTAAAAHADELLDIMRRLGDDDGVGRALRARAQAVGAAGDFALAVESSERSVRIYRALGDREAEAWSMTVLGFVHFVADDIDRGAEADTSALRLLEAVGEAPSVSCRAHTGLSFAAARRGDAVAHRRHLAASIADLRLLGALDVDTGWRWSGVSLAHTEGRMASVLRLAGAARVLDRRGDVLPPAADAVCRAAIAAAEAAVGQPAAERLLAEGAVMSVEDAVIEALATPTVQAAPLSARELEIAGLTGRGLTNAEIAERLFISRRTVESHQENIREKLGLSSRYEVIAWVLSRESV